MTEKLRRQSLHDDKIQVRPDRCDLGDDAEGSVAPERPHIGNFDTGGHTLASEPDASVADDQAIGQSEGVSVHEVHPLPRSAEEATTLTEAEMLDLLHQVAGVSRAPTEWVYPKDEREWERSTSVDDHRRWLCVNRLPILSGAPLPDLSGNVAISDLQEAIRHLLLSDLEFRDHTLHGHQTSSQKERPILEPDTGYGEAIDILDDWLIGVKAATAKTYLKHARTLRNAVESGMTNTEAKQFHSDIIGYATAVIEEAYRRSGPYSAASSFWLAANIFTEPDPANQIVLMAAYLLTDTSRVVDEDTVKRGRRADYPRKMPRADYDSIQAKLEFGSGKHDQLLFHIMEIVWETGVRPNESHDMKWQPSVSGGLLIEIRNSKFERGIKGCGPTRTLTLENPSQEFLSALAFLKEARGGRTAEEWDEVLEKCDRRLREICKQLFVPATTKLQAKKEDRDLTSKDIPKKKRYRLYSIRHQWMVDLWTDLTSGNDAISTEEADIKTAAAAGHGSDRTRRLHYSKGAKAEKRTGGMVRPTLATEDLVRPQRQERIERTKQRFKAPDLKRFMRKD